MEDGKIIEMLFDRQEQALRELEKQYGKLCYQLSLRIVCDKRDAEECVNEAYLGVWNDPSGQAALTVGVCMQDRQERVSELLSQKESGKKKRRIRSGPA